MLKDYGQKIFTVNMVNVQAMKAFKQFTINYQHERWKSEGYKYVYQAYQLDIHNQVYTVTVYLRTECNIFPEYVFDNCDETEEKRKVFCIK